VARRRWSGHRPETQLMTTFSCPHFNVGPTIYVFDFEPDCRYGYLKVILRPNCVPASTVRFVNPSSFAYCRNAGVETSMRSQERFGILEKLFGFCSRQMYK